MDPTLVQILSALFNAQVENAQLRERVRWLEQEREDLKRSQGSST